MTFDEILAKAAELGMDYFAEEFKASSGPTVVDFKRHMAALLQHTGLSIEEAGNNWVLFDTESYTEQPYSVMAMFHEGKVIMSATSHAYFAPGRVSATAVEVMQRGNLQMKAKFRLVQPANKPTRVIVALQTSPSSLTATAFSNALVELVGSISGFDMVLEASGHASFDD